MILIEAGASKTIFCELENKKSKGQIRLVGINPSYMDAAEIKSILLRAFDTCTTNDQVYYYGAGCASQQNQQKISEIISSFGVFNTIEVKSDLMASAIAAAGNNAGQINILGTGSASCLYNGQQIEKIYFNGGHLFADQGSGYQIGFTLLQAYFNKLLPQNLVAALEAYTGLSKDDLLNTIYTESNQKKYIADFSKFIYDNRDDYYIQNLIEYAFDSFITYQMQQNVHYLNSRQYFSGSIAEIFQDELRSCLHHKGISISNICQSPFENLLNFHLK